MRKIRDVLRYRHSAGLSLDATARALNLSKGVVAKYIRLASAAGLSWPLPDDLDDVTAAALANPGLSSWAALTMRAGLRRGETVRYVASVQHAIANNGKTAAKAILVVEYSPGT